MSESKHSEAEMIGALKYASGTENGRYFVVSIMEHP